VHVGVRVGVRVSGKHLVGKCCHFRPDTRPETFSRLKFDHPWTYLGVKDRILEYNKRQDNGRETVETW
jgi:hypothetical protein